MKVEFTSQLALSQRNMVTQGIELLASQIASMEEFYPGSVDLFKKDTAIRHMAGGFLAPPDVIADEGEVNAIRQAQAELQAEQAKMEQEAMQAKMARDLGGANVNTGTALGQISQQAGNDVVTAQ